MAAGDDDGIVIGAPAGIEGDPREVQCGEQVGVSQLGREGDPQEVEGAHRAVAIDGELRDAVAAHEGLEVGPHRVGALAQRVIAAIEHLVEDLDPLVRRTHLVGIGIHQRPAHGHGVPVLADGVDLAAHVLDRLLHQGEHAFELLEDALDGHGASVTNG